MDGPGPMRVLTLSTAWRALCSLTHLSLHSWSFSWYHNNEGELRMQYLVALLQKGPSGGNWIRRKNTAKTWITFSEGVISGWSKQSDIRLNTAVMLKYLLTVRTFFTLPVSNQWEIVRTPKWKAHCSWARNGRKRLDTGIHIAKQSFRTYSRPTISLTVWCSDSFFLCRCLKGKKWELVEY